MKQILKYELRPLSTSLIAMPIEAEIVHVGCKPGDTSVYIWAKSNVDDGNDTRSFVVIGTGQEFDGDDDDLGFVGSCITHDGFVWHVFEEI